MNAKVHVRNDDCMSMMVAVAAVVGARWLETLFHQFGVRKRADLAFKV